MVLGVKIYFGFPVREIKEGGTNLVVPDHREFKIPEDAPVFYNPEMDLSRDTSVVFLDSLKVNSAMDPLAATGARGIRYLNETSIDKIFLNDINSKAVKMIKRNVEINNLRENAVITESDANSLLNQDKRVGFIDLDPFGSPMNFLDSALRLNPKYLALTATDTAPLCGAYVNACKRKYNSRPLRTSFCHEIGLRILIGQSVRYASKYDIKLEVLFSHSSKHFFRTFFKLENGAKLANEAFKELGYLYYCPDCLKREFEKSFFSRTIKCEKCSREMKTAGPIWLGNLKDNNFLDKMINKSEQKTELNQKDKVLKLLEGIRREIDEISYYDLHNIAGNYNIRVPSTDSVKQKLKEQGFEVSSTHFSPTSIKTNSGISEIVKIMKSLD